VAGHGIDVRDYKYQENAEDYLSWVGRLVANKGLEFFPEIQKLTQKKIKFGGGGEESKFYQENLKSEIENNQNLIFLGPQDLAQKNELIGRSKFFINPRIMKPTGGVAGLVVAEANACGTPVIAFDSEGMREIIKDGVNGFLVESGDPEAFCDKIKELNQMTDEAYQELRKSTRKYAEENFTVEKMVDGYEKLYKNLKEDFDAKD